MGNFYDGAARCSGRKFRSEIFTHLVKHFCAYLELHLASHPDLGIIGKMFSSCTSWVWMKPILVKRDDIRSARRAKAHHSRLQASTGVNGVIKSPFTDLFVCFAATFFTFILESSTKSSFMGIKNALHTHDMLSSVIFAPRSHYFL